jgi:hypothetical protein
MFDSLGWKSAAQPGAGEGLAKRKGVVVRRGLKEATNTLPIRLWKLGVAGM